MSADYRIFWGHRVPQLEREYIAQVITWGKGNHGKKPRQLKAAEDNTISEQTDGIIYRTDRVFRK